METFENILNNDKKQPFFFKEKRKEGMLFHKSKNMYYFETNTKTYSVMPVKEGYSLSFNPLNVGDLFPLTITGTMDSPSTKNGIKSKIWDLTCKAHEQKLQLPGRLLAVQQGGGAVGFLGLIGFMPNRFLFQKKAKTFKRWITRSKPVPGDIILLMAREVYPKTKRVVFSRKKRKKSK